MSPGTSNNWGLYVYHWHNGLPVVDGASDWQFWSSNPTDYTIVPHNGAGTITNYTLTIPESARVQRLYLNFGWAAMDGADQSQFRSGDLGITRLGFQRRQPMNVIIGLDTPEGSAFVRSGTSLLQAGGKKIKKDLSKEERYESVLSMLNASREYTDMILGIQFPGSNTLLWGNEIQGSDVEKYHEKERARQAKIAQARFDADPSQHGSAAWRAKQKEMYPTVNDHYADWADKLKGANGQPLFPEGYRVYSGRAGGRHSPNDSRAQILSRIHPPWVKFKRPTQTRGRTAADIKADFEAGKHIKHLPHRQKWLAARQAKAERDLARKRERQMAKDSKGRSSSRAVSKPDSIAFDSSNYIKRSDQSSSSEISATDAQWAQPDTDSFTQAFWGGKTQEVDPTKKQGRGTHMNIINYYNSGGSMGEMPEGWTKDDVNEYIKNLNNGTLQKSHQRSSDVQVARMTNYERGLIKSGQVPYMSPGRARELLSDPEILKMDDDVIIRQLQRLMVDKGDSGQQIASGDMWDKVLKDIEKSSDKLKNQPQKDYPYYGRPGRGMGDRWKAEGDSGTEIAMDTNDARRLIRSGQVPNLTPRQAREILNSPGAAAGRLAAVCTTKAQCSTAAAARSNEGTLAQNPKNPRTIKAL